MAKETFVQLCPICGSKNFSLYTDDKIRDFASVEPYKCNRCRNIFVFPLELPKSKADKIKKVPLTKAILNDTPVEAIIPVGLVEIGVTWKILGAILAICGIFFMISALIPVNCLVNETAVNCILNDSPLKTAMLGLAMTAAGFYVLLESYIITKLHMKQTKLLKIGLVAALLIAALFPILMF